MSFNTQSLQATYILHRGAKQFYQTIGSSSERRQITTVLRYHVISDLEFMILQIMPFYLLNNTIQYKFKV